MYVHEVQRILLSDVFLYFLCDPVCEGALGLRGSVFGSSLAVSSGRSNVNCNGNEARLQDCSYDIPSSQSCELASAVCQGDHFITLL